MSGRGDRMVCGEGGWSELRVTLAQRRISGIPPYVSNTLYSCKINVHVVKLISIV